MSSRNKGYLLPSGDRIHIGEKIGFYDHRRRSKIGVFMRRGGYQVKVQHCSWIPVSQIRKLKSEKV